MSEHGAPSLEELRARHEAVARYTVSHNHRHPVKRTVTIDTGLRWAPAQELRDRLQREQDERFELERGHAKLFGDPLYSIILENPMECRSEQALERMVRTGEITAEQQAAELARRKVALEAALA